MARYLEHTGGARSCPYVLIFFILSFHPMGLQLFLLFIFLLGLGGAEHASIQEALRGGPKVLCFVLFVGMVYAGCLDELQGYSCTPRLRITLR